MSYDGSLLQQRLFSRISVNHCSSVCFALFKDDESRLYLRIPCRSTKLRPSGGLPPSCFGKAGKNCFFVTFFGVQPPLPFVLVMRKLAVFLRGLTDTEILPQL